jgi:PAS domain S-box-containing protein
MSDAGNQDRYGASWDSSNPRELYRILVEEAADGLFITDPQGRFVAVTPRGIELTGYFREELLGLNFTDLIPPEDLTRDPIRMDELRQGKIVIKERRFRRKDGGLVAVEVSARMLPEGNLLGIVRDITECKQAGIRSFASLPVRAGEEIIGVIGLASLTERDFEARADFLETLNHQVSVALANAQLFEASRSELARRQQGEQKLRKSESVSNRVLSETSKWITSSLLAKSSLSRSTPPCSALRTPSGFSPCAGTSPSAGGQTRHCASPSSP